MGRILTTSHLPSPVAWLGALADLGVPAAYWEDACARWCGAPVEIIAEECVVRGVVARRVTMQAALPTAPDAKAVRASLPRGDAAAAGWQRLGAAALAASPADPAVPGEDWLLMAGIALGLAYLDVTAVYAAAVDAALPAPAVRAWVQAAEVEAVPEWIGYGTDGTDLLEMTLGYARPAVWTREMPYVFGDTSRARESVTRR